jgi:hypothetical protein
MMAPGRGFVTGSKSRLDREEIFFLGKETILLESNEAHAKI